MNTSSIQSQLIYNPGRDKERANQSKDTVKSDSLLQFRGNLIDRSFSEAQTAAGKAHLAIQNNPKSVVFRGTQAPVITEKTIGEAGLKPEDRRWWKEGVVYQIYPRSFKDTNGDGIGDIKGIINKLDYLKELGVDILWLNPIYKSPNDDNGYDISDYQDIMKEFGSLKDCDELLQEAHKRGMKIVMDLVVNHSSDEHKWFVEAKKSKDNPYRDFYIWSKPDKNGGPPNDWGSCFGGPAWELDEKTGDYYLHLFSKKQPDLNWRNPKLRQEVYDMMNWWLDKGVDGLRMDVINLISKPEKMSKSDVKGGVFENCCFGPEIHNYLKEMNQKTLKGRDVMTVGECPGATVEDALKVAGKDSDELNMIFTFEHVDLDGEPGWGKWSTNRVNMGDLRNVITKWQTGLEGKAWNSIYLMNHDQPRALSRFGNDSPQFRNVSAKMLATMALSLQGTPYIYMGEEIGMTNVKFDSIKDYRDIETLNFYKESMEKGRDEQDVMKRIHAKSRDNSRTPMQWDSTPNAGFTNGKPWINVNPNYKDINLENERKDPDSIFNYYKQMIQVRKDNPVLVYGKFDLLAKDNDKIFAYTRTLGEEKVLVVLNFSDQNTDFSHGIEVDPKYAERIIGNYKPDSDEDINNMKLKPYESRIYRLS